MPHGQGGTTVLHTKGQSGMGHQSPKQDEEIYTVEKSIMKSQCPRK